MSEIPDRNGPCPCGSGKKYKNCCINKKFVAPKTGSRTIFYVVLTVAVAVIAGAAMINNLRNPAPTVVPTSNAPKTTPDASGLYPQPAGPVPPGKVWSPEHDHWHDAASPTGASTPLAPISMPQPAAPTYTPGPPPPGPAPEGKYWSTEHGHWHNVPGYIDSKTDLNADGTTTAPEPAPAENKPASEFIEGPIDDDGPAQSEK